MLVSGITGEGLHRRLAERLADLDMVLQQKLRLLRIARAADSDEWRKRVRDLIERQDVAGLKQMAERPDVIEQSAATVSLLAQAISDFEERNGAAELLIACYSRHRDDFRINHQLGCTLMASRPPQPYDALRYLQVALALRPKSPGLISNIGWALTMQGRPKEALAAFREAIAVGGPNWKWGGVHVNLGNALTQTGQVEEAIACYRKAIDLDPKHVNAHYNRYHARRSRQVGRSDRV